MNGTPIVAISVVAIILSAVAVTSAVVLKPTSTIGTGAVGTNELADNSVTGTKIASGAITDTDIVSAGISKIANNAVGSGQIADNSITMSDLSSALANTITGVENIADNSVTSAKIADGTITTDDIATGTVTSSDIADGTIVVADLATAVSSRLGKVATKIVATDGSGDYMDIQSAINSLPATGGEVYVREGTYTISSSITIPSNVVLIGAGAATKIFLANGANVDVIVASSAKDIIIANLSIDGNKANQTAGGHGIKFVNVENSTISGCKVEKSYYRGIHLEGSSNNVITNNNLSTNDAQGIMIFSNSNNNSVLGNTVKSNDAEGVALISSFNNTIIGNTVRSNRGSGIYLRDSNNNVLMGNVGINNSQIGAGITDGIYLQSSDYNTITSNRCADDQVVKTQSYGVNISDAACDFNLVDGNVLAGNLMLNGLNDASGGDTTLGANIT
jgi:parallel beta-helix repeat protein